MPAKAPSFAVISLEGAPIDVDAGISRRLASFIILGLPDIAVQESRERVRAAIKNADCRLPTQRITVNLAPADLLDQPRCGTDFRDVKGQEHAKRALEVAAAGGGCVLMTGSERGCSRWAQCKSRKRAQGTLDKLATLCYIGKCEDMHRCEEPT